MFLYNKQEGVREDSLFCFLLRSIKFEYNQFKTIRLETIIFKTKKTVCQKADTQFLKIISLLS